MKKRAISSIFIVLATALAIVSKLLVAEIFDIFIAIIAVISASEMCNMFTQKNKEHNRFIASMYIVALYFPIVFCAEYSINFGQLLLWMLVAFAVWTLVGWIYEFSNNIRNNKEKIMKSSLKKIGNTALIGIYPSCLLSCFFIINHFSDFSVISNKYFTLWFVILVFAITMLTDTFAYLIGSTLKGPKVCPKISPKKSWSGCIGGLIGGIVGALIIYAILQINIFESILSISNLNIGWFIFLGAFGSVISQVGDFFESYLKRRAGVKDSGNLFPGHGGMLDRVDALMFCVVYVTFFLIIAI